MASIATTELAITMIPVDQIEPNRWNPNRMTDEQTQEYMDEVQRLGRLPKPVVVREKGDDRYEIVDGEHGWRAAKGLDFAEVLCEVVEVDNFTARLETLKRNQHGDHNKLLEGRMFLDMMEMRGLNQSELAREAGFSEGTIRNALDYTKAAELRAKYLQEYGPAPVLIRNESDEEPNQIRNSCESGQTADGGRNSCESGQTADGGRNSYESGQTADRGRNSCESGQTADGGRNSCESGQTADGGRNSYENELADTEIGKLSVRQVGLYLKLPDIIRDRWLNASGSKLLLKPYLKGGPAEMCDLLEPIVQYGLADLINDRVYLFQETVNYALDLCAWLDSHLNVPEAEAYVRAVADRAFDVSTLEHLPLKVSDGQPVVLVSPEEWAAILCEADDQAAGDEALHAVICSGVRVVLRKNGINPAEVLGPSVAELLQVLEDAPDYIRDASHMTLEEQFELHFCRCAGASEEMCDNAKRMTVHRLQRHRDKSRSDGNQPTAAGASSGVTSVFNELLRELRLQGGLVVENELFEDHARLVEHVVDTLTEGKALDAVVVGDRRAIDVLREHLLGLDPAMLALVGASMHGTALVVSPAKRWLQAIAQRNTLP